VTPTGSPISPGCAAGFDEARWASWNLVRTLVIAAAFVILVAAVGAHG
jgi:hypothetical protein